MTVDRSHKILLVEPDAELLEILVASLARRFDPHITCVSNAASCLDLELVDPHDLVIAELDLEDSHGVLLAERLLSLGNRPIILLADEPTSDDVIDAMRVGVRDMFRKPFPVEQLLDAADAALRDHSVHRRRAVKYRRMRELVRRVVSERRDLNRRIDLVCRDLVGAQRRLVNRVLALEDEGTRQAT